MDHSVKRLNQIHSHGTQVCFENDLQFVQSFPFAIDLLSELDNALLIQWTPFAERAVQFVPFFIRPTVEQFRELVADI